MKTRYGFQQVDEVEVFYREAGPSDAPAILLLNGFPTASHMFRDLIPLLSNRFRLVAPDRSQGIVITHSSKSLSVIQL